MRVKFFLMKTSEKTIHENNTKKTEEVLVLTDQDQMEVGPVTFWRQKIASVTLVLREHLLGQIQNMILSLCFCQTEFILIKKTGKLEI